MTNFQLIRQFHEKFDPINTDEPMAELLVRRVQYMFEEFQETAEAAEVLLSAPESDKQIAKAALVKELTDVLNVTYGFLHLLNVDADAAFAEVHRSNMSKTPNPGGKAIKGESYTPANLEQFISTETQTHTLSNTENRTPNTGH